jgi:hypothetical protein
MLSGDDTLYFGSLSNLVTNRKVGTSQVTAIVRRSSEKIGAKYRAVLVVQLVAPHPQPTHLQFVP